MGEMWEAWSPTDLASLSPHFQPLSPLHRPKDPEEGCLKSSVLENKYPKKQQLVSRSKVFLMLYRPLASFHKTKMTIQALAG